MSSLGSAGVIAVARPAHAQPCGSAARPWVSVAFAAGPWPERFEQAVLGDLAAGLRRRDIDACPEGAGPSQAPIAAVRLTRRGGTTVAVAVEVRDAVTEKRVSRDLDLRGVPNDGRAFALALATDELVWASWAELGLKRKKSRAVTTAPPEVIAGVESELPSTLSSTPSRSPARLGARVAAERFVGGQTHLGGDAVLLLPLAMRFERVGLELALGLRQGQRVEAQHGHVLSSAVGLGAMLRVRLLRALPLELSLFAGPRAGLARFTAASPTRAGRSARSRAVCGAAARRGSERARPLG